MELPFVAHLSPVETFSAHYFGISDSGKESPIYRSDSSMDAEVHDILKLKQTPEEDFFSWTGDIRASLGGEKENVINSSDIIHKNCQLSTVKTQQTLSQYTSRKSDNIDKVHGNIYGKEHFTNISSTSKQIPLYDNVQVKEFSEFSETEEQNRMGNKEDDQSSKNPGQYPKPSGKTMGKGGNVTGENNEGEVRSEIDLYLEKSQMAATGNQAEAATSSVIRKRKLEAANPWTTSKMSRAVGSSNQRDVISTSRMSSEWQDLDVDLPNELSSPSYNMSEALLSLPVFKEEAPSPTGANASSPPWLNRQNNMINNNLVINTNNGNSCSGEQQSNNVGHMTQSCPPRNQQGMNVGNSQNQMIVPQGQQQQLATYQPGVLQSATNQNNEHSLMDVTNGLLNYPMENFGSCMKPAIQALPDSAGSCDNRFQYVLAAATSIATKCNEDTLTYLNQCQSYEIKLKKLGDLSHFRGKILKSIIRICFHERRLQYAEREQMAQWQNERPGERIVEVDVPLSYGLLNVFQPTEQPLLNTVEIYWDPVKEAGVYIKVNCISTEFTAKKHGGEKGVPFRIQVETFLPGDVTVCGNNINKLTPAQADKRLHAAACQIKVFKLKGADRKHKQDREKILRRPECEREKYQPSYECTVFSDLPLDAMFSPVGISSTQPYSPDGGNLPARPSAPSSASPPRIEGPLQQLTLSSPHNEVKVQSLSRANSHGSSLDCDEDNVCRGIIQGNTVTAGDEIDFKPLTERTSASDTRAWLTKNRFSSFIPTFSNFSGADLLRLSRDDLIRICSLADGIRLYNAMHAEFTPARLTLYAKKVGEKPFSAIYLKSYQASELKAKLSHIIQDGSGVMTSEISTVYVSGPNGIKVNLTDEVIQNIRNDSMFCLDTVEEGIIMKPA